MKKNLQIQNILKNSKKDTDWKKEAEERNSARQESRKSGIIATQLAYYMKANGISQTDLGNRIGVSPQQISKILKGRENLTLGTIEKIEDALQIDLIAPVSLEANKPKLEPAGSRSIHLELGTRSIGYQIHDTANSIERKSIYYGGSIKVEWQIASLPNDYFEQMIQKAKKRAQDRFDRLGIENSDINEFKGIVVKRKYLEPTSKTEGWIDQMIEIEKNS
jgi:transcriptional regulator with XRE-family HTH domain